MKHDRLVLEGMGLVLVIVASKSNRQQHFQQGQSKAGYASPCKRCTCLAANALSVSTKIERKEFSKSPLTPSFSYRQSCVCCSEVK